MHRIIFDQIEADKQSLFDDDDDDLFGASNLIKKESPPSIPKKVTPVVEAKPARKVNKIVMLG
jgi:hypothetical protein